jgi:threonylcarbamoyladenosine tRNA methylthiotransferase MtaB
MPDACIGVDVIVGFPQETQKEFLETYQFLNELPISYLHVFTYSERPNTKAIQMQGVVAPALRAERSKQLHILSDKKRQAFYQSQIGKEGVVLWEQEVKEGKVFGFTENYVRLSAPYQNDLPNQLQKVVLGELQADGTLRALVPSFAK